ncbi:flavin-containing monooxygenase [Rhodococcus koreensis]
MTRFDVLDTVSIFLFTNACSDEASFGSIAALRSVSTETKGWVTMTSETTMQDDPLFQENLSAALQDANVPTLQMLVVQLTGDMSWLEEPYRPTRCQGSDDNDSGGLEPELQERIREAAYDAITAWREGREVAYPEISTDLLLHMMRVSVGEEIPEEYAPLMAAKFDSYLHPERQTRSIAELVPNGFEVLIVGAGMSGIAMAVRLKAAGVPFRIVEKGEDVGGVWNQHHYPGCGVDTPSHLYSYSFAQGDWNRYFASRDEVKANYRKVAEDFGILQNIAFNTEVIETRYDEGSHLWRSRLRRADGTEEEITTNLLVTAVGAFATPKWPDIEGLDTFKGDLLHTAWWDHSVELENKRVGVIGVGASAMQLVPAIADRVESLTVYQRSRQWVAPFPKFKKEIPGGIKFLLSEIPLYEWWYRLRLSWIFDSKTYASLHKDPQWPHPDRSLNAINDGHRRFFTRYINSELGDRQDLAERVTPDFPPNAKRMLLDNGWYRTLKREHVELVDAPIEKIDETGIANKDGTHRELDVIVAASGYDVARFLSSINVYGRSGTSVRAAWDDDNPKAYNGTVTPGFPNMFMLFGPSTSLGHGGSFIFITECQINYVMSAIEQMLRNNNSEVECRADVCTDYNDRMDEKHQGMIWTHPGVSSYYRNDHGRVVMNSPWKTVEFWERTKQANMNDFVTATSQDR